MPRPPPLIKESNDDSDDDACNDCLDGNCGQCVDIEEDKLKTDCTKCCVGYVVVCSFNVLFVHSLMAGLCIGLISGAMARDPARLSVIETILGRDHGRIAQDILLAAGIVGVIFLAVYLPIRCFGLKSAKCQVALDISFLLLLLCLTSAAGFMGIVASDGDVNLREKLKDYVMIDYKGDTSDSNDALWDRTQIGYHCCGASSAEDYYINSTWWYMHLNTTTRNVPLSCCRRSTDGQILSEVLCQSTAYGIQIGAITDTTEPTFVYTKSCSEELEYAFNVYIAQIIALSFSMIFLEGCGICFAVYIYFLRNRRTVNPADRYRVTEDVEDNRLFKRRETGKIPYMSSRSEKTESSQMANGTAGHEGPAISDTSEPVPGTSTGGETPSKGSPAGPPRTTEAEKRIIDMFAAQRPGYMDKPKAAEPNTSLSTRSDQEIIDMFNVDKPDEKTASQIQSVFEPRSDDTDRNVFDEKMGMFTASGERKKSTNGIVGNGSISREKHDISTEDDDQITQGQIEVKAANGTINIEGTNEQETAT